MHEQFCGQKLVTLTGFFRGVTNKGGSVMCSFFCTFVFNGSCTINKAKKVDSIVWSRVSILCSLRCYATFKVVQMCVHRLVRQLAFRFKSP